MKAQGQNFYTYLHIKETDGSPFYVGKGVGNRAFQKTNRSKWWNNTVNKYGYDVIFLDSGLTEEDSFNLEIYWIDRIGKVCDLKGTLVNLTNGGEGASGYKWTEEARKRNSIANKGKEPWNKGLKMTDEYCKNVSRYKKGIDAKNRKIVLDIDSGVYYYSASEAALFNDIKLTTLTEQLNGKRKSTNKKLMYV